jgi:cobalt-zinc-cadmium efflux system outer membrane protein
MRHIIANTAWVLVVFALMSLSPTSRCDAQVLASMDSTPAMRYRRLVLTSNPELTARRATVEAAGARARAAGAATPATVTLDVDEVPGGNLADAQSAGTSLSWDLFTAGRRSLRRALAERETDEAALHLRLVERRVLARSDQLLIRLVGTLAIGSRLAAEDSLLSAAEEALQARFAVGEARYVDVIRLRTERLRVQSDLAGAVTEVGSHRRALVALAHVDLSATVEALLDSAIAIELTDPFRRPLAAAPDLDSLVAASAPALLATVEVDRAAAARRLAGAERRPLVGASLGVRRFATEGGGFDVGPSIALSIALPFTAPAAGGQVEAAARDLDAAHAMRQAEVARAKAELGAARDRYETARRRLAVYDAAALQGARDEREAALAAYRSGGLSLLELLDFERALSRAEITRLQTLTEAADALAVLQGGAP